MLRIRKQVKKSIIREFREKFNILQKDLAKKLKISQANISKWETFEYYPTEEHMNMLIKFAKSKGFKITIESLRNGI